MTRPTRIRISRREAFNAAHQLWDPARSDDENRRLFGKCVNLHGHNYAVEVVVRGDVDPATGYLIDLKRLSDRIPTAENLALAFWARLRPHLPDGSLQSVRVYETEKNWAECSDAE